MKKPLILVLLLFLPLWLLSQNAPVTTAGRVTNAAPGNTSVQVPLTISGFNNIGKFTLTLKFDTTRIRYVSSTTNSQLANMNVDYTPPPVGSTQGKLLFTWTGANYTNVSLADGAAIANLVFHYVTGTGILNWSYILGSVCQYKRYVGTNLTVLDDAPKYEYYLNGGISNRSAPVISAPSISTPVPGALNVPLTVNGFTTITGFTLYLEYDTTVITFDTCIRNSAFGPSFQAGDNTGAGAKKIIIIQWFGSSTTLASGSALCTLNFSYPAANCNPTALSWLDSGGSCEYTDNLNDVLIDMPQPTYYIDGVVAPGLYPTWTGAVSADWSNAANWNACGVPVIMRKAIIPNVSPNPSPVVSSAASCKSLTVKSGATMTILLTGSVTVEDD
jgi:hypothetical protein